MSNIWKIKQKDIGYWIIDIGNYEKCNQGDKISLISAKNANFIAYKNLSKNNFTRPWAVAQALFTWLLPLLPHLQ